VALKSAITEEYLWASAGASPPPVEPSAIRQDCCAVSHVEACMMRRCWPRGMHDTTMRSFSFTCRNVKKRQK